MKLYVVEKCYDYEGGLVVGVYDDLEAAKKVADELMGDPETYADDSVVYEVDLGCFYQYGGKEVYTVARKRRSK